MADKPTATLDRSLSAPVACKQGPTTESERANVNRFQDKVPIGYGGKVDANGWVRAASPGMGKK